jgi:septal ring-binding cell division protein DamX
VVICVDLRREKDIPISLRLRHISAPSDLQTVAYILLLQRLVEPLSMKKLKAGNMIMKIEFTRIYGVIAGLLMLSMIGGCAAKTYVDIYADPTLNPLNIKTVTIVVDDIRVTEQYNLLFADTFLKTAMAKKHFPLARKNYILKEKLSGPEPSENADAYLEIALTHCYPGNRSQNFPTSVGAVAKLVDTKTRNVLWRMNYAYASPKSGTSAPMVEEVMHRVSDKIIDAVPLAPEKPGYAAYTVDPGVQGDVRMDAPVPDAEISDKSPSLKARLSGARLKRPETASGADKAHSTQKEGPSQTKRIGSDTTPRRQSAGAYMIHVASVKKRHLAEQFINMQPTDGTVRLSTTVQLNPDRPWYRLLVGRFRTPDESRQYIQAMKQNGRPDAYAKPMKLPYSLMISSGRPFEPSQKIVEALRKIDYMAYLAPSPSAAHAYDVLVGAYENRKEADKRAQLLLTNGIPVEVVAP